MGQKVVQKIGKYEILSELGQGGMGTVYKARDPLIARLVALKTVNPDLTADPEVLQRFYREAQAAGALQHPNIVTVFDLGEFEGHPYIAMEFVEGESLQSIIARQAKIPLASKLKLAEQVCLGLEHAHKNGIVHRDVKPGNILVKNDGTVKVVDFGIVHIETTTLTKTGSFMGTIQYASPEQLNEGTVDQRSDLWSVTCVLYELIAYKKPFEGGNFGAVVSKILNSEPEPLSQRCPGVPAELDTIIAKGLKKNVWERYQSLEQLLADLVPIEQTLERSLIGELLGEARQMKEKGDLNGAQEKVRAILLLESTHGEAIHLSSEITAELQRLSSLPRVRELVSQGEHAYQRGEYAEAIRALEAALELNPHDTQARNLKERAARKQERLRQVREGLTAGQKALKEGDLTAAEMELQKVIALDQNNTQASGLLAEIRRDRLGREKDFGLKEILWKADNLISEGKYRDAKLELVEVLREFPDAQEVRQKLHEVNNRLSEPAAAGGLPGKGPAIDQAKWRETRLAEVSKLLAGDDIPRATVLLKDVKELYPSDPEVEALLQQAQQKIARPVGQPIEPAPPLRSLGMMLGGIALAVALGIGSFLYYHHAHPARRTSATAEEIQLEHDAKLLQDYGNRNAALEKWRNLAAQEGPLQNEAIQAVAQITNQQEIENQETTLFSQGMAAQQAEKWDQAVALYQKVADLNGPMKEQALQAISSVKELQAGANISTLEKEKYDHAMAALAQQDYAQARVLFQQVLDLKVPGSTLAAKAQTQLDTVKAALQTQKEFDAADKAQRSGDLSGALAHFQNIASKPGPFQAQAQSRIQQIAANQQKQQAERALQDNLRKFQDLKSQKRYGDAAALLPTISQGGGDANELKNGLESAEQSDVQNLINQFNQAKNKKDAATLQQLRSQFQTLASASGAPAIQAHDYAENQIPPAIAQINQANQLKPPPPPALAGPSNPLAHAPVVTLIVSGTYRPWTRSVQKGDLVPEYNVEGGLKPVSLAMPAGLAAPSGSIVTLKINIDEDGNVTPDIVLYDPTGMGPAVMDAAKKWKFNPPMVKGKTVKTSVAVKVTF
jgi:serine/threonine-protein kinase